MKALPKPSLFCLSLFLAMAVNAQQKKNTISYRQTPGIAAGKIDSWLAVPEHCAASRSLPANE